jgi:putative ABC transport system permease protein
MRRILVGAQFAIATPLLIVAGLLLGSLNQLRQVDLGYDTQQLLIGSIRLPATQYTEAPRMEGFWDELKLRIEAMPSVTSVAFADGLPPNQVGDHNNFDLEDHPTPPGGSQPVTPWVGISPEYVRTVGLKLVDGRLLDQRDVNTGNLVVDRAWQRRFFPNDSAVGKRLKNGGCTTCDWNVVVGVVSEVKYDGLDQPDMGTVYRPLYPSTSQFLIVRTEGDPLAIAPAVRQAVRELEPAAPLTNISTIGALVDQSLAKPQSLSTLVATFAGVALLLSIIGIYGVMGYYVQQQLKEISIRMALGGSRSDVAKLVVGQGMIVVVAGVAIGVAIALSATRLMASLLFRVGAADPLTFTSVVLLLSATALLACAVPAWRAMRLQPASVLRNE